MIRKSPAVTNDSNRTVDVQPPSPSSALYLIYQKDGDGADSYEVENGSWTTYWYGYQFDLDGRQYQSPGSSRRSTLSAPSSVIA